jgi:hypothetical protein
MTVGGFDYIATSPRLMIKMDESSCSVGLMMVSSGANLTSSINYVAFLRSSLENWSKIAHRSSVLPFRWNFSSSYNELDRVDTMVLTS